MLPRSAALIQRKTNKIEMVQRRAARWVTNDYSPYSSVSNMLSNLGWRSLEKRRYDARLITFKFMSLLPSRFRHFLSDRKDTPTTCILFRSDKFTPLSATICIHFSLWPLFFGTEYQLISSRFQILTPLNQESLRSITPFRKRAYCFYPDFKLFLLTLYLLFSPCF